VRRERHTASQKKWPDAMELYCRGCSESAGENVSKSLSQFHYAGVDTAWNDVVSKGMERFCRRCFQKDHASGDSVLAPGPALNLCPWCQRETEAKLTHTQRFCRSCCDLRFKCSKCSKAAKRNVLKPLAAFSLERMRLCKQQHTLTTRLVCVACDTSEELPSKYRFKETHYACSQCLQTKPREEFPPAALRNLESNQQVYLAVCEACASPGQPGASEKHVKCEHCSQTLPLHAYSTAFTRFPRRKWTCLTCQHPKCTGDGCEARQPMARVGTYTCEQCLYPPCHKCMTTPRPRSTKYRVTHLPQWVCSTCASPGQPGAS